MNRDTSKKLISAFLYIIGVVLSWGGMIYATSGSGNFRPIGVVVALVGYCVVLGSVLLYESLCYRQ